jgi:hypothetical protein
MLMISTNIPYGLAGKLKYFSGGYFREQGKFPQSRP